MTTHSNAQQRQREGQRQAATPLDPTNEYPNAQARRAHAPAREPQPNIPDLTKGDREVVSPGADWRADLADFLRRQACFTTAPVLPGELWWRVQMRAGRTEGWLPTALNYVGGAVGYALTSALLAVAWLAHQPFGGAPLTSLTELWDRADATADRVDDRYTSAAIRFPGGGAACVVTAVCYAAAYIVQFPALVVLLALCGGTAFVTSLL